MTMIPLYLTIREDLLRNFQETGERKLPAELELCRRYGVCRPTVQKALSYLQENDLIVRLPGKGSFFRESPEKKSSRIKSVFGVIRKDWKDWENNTYFCTLLQGVIAALGPEYSLTLQQYSEDMFHKLLSDDSVATLWISPEHDEMTAMKLLADADRVVLAINRNIGYPGICQVLTDHCDIGQQVANAWKNAGLSHICMVHLEAEQTLHSEVASGFQNANRIGHYQLTCHSVTVPQNEWQIQAVSFFQKLLADGERAFLLCTGALVPMILEAIEHENLALGSQVSLLVLGDEPGFENLGISAVRSPGVTMGKSAGEIIRGTEKRREIIYQEELIRRISF